MKRHFTLTALLAALIAGPALAGLLWPKTVAADCSTLPSSLGTASLTLNIDSAGTYRVWVRELAPTADAGGFYLQIPDAGVCQASMGNATISANAWTWVDYQNAATSSTVDVNLSAGNHAVTLAGLKPGVEVDRLMLLTDTACTPTGDGSNCASAAAISATPTPSGSSPTSQSTDKGIPGNPNAPIPKSANPISNVVAAAGRYRNPLIFAGLLVLAVPLLWFTAQHLGLIHPAEPTKASALDLPGQPKSHSTPPEPATKLPEPRAPDAKPPKPKIPVLPDDPPAPKPGSTSAPTHQPPPGAPPQSH